MAQIDQYIKDAKQDDIGSEIADRAGQEAKSQAKPYQNVFRTVWVLPH